MNTDTVIPSEILADMERAVQLTLSGKRDLEFEQRIRAEAERIRSEILQKHGVLDIGVDLVRELRDEE
jgi:hypothetical protein